MDHQRDIGDRGKKEDVIMMSVDELPNEDLERIIRAVIEERVEERLDLMEFTIKIDFGKIGEAGKRGVAQKRTPEQWREFWKPRIINAIGIMWHRAVDDPSELKLPTFALLRSYVNVPTRLKDEELFIQFSLFLDELVKQGVLYISELDRGRGLKQFYDFTPSSGIDRSQWGRDQDGEGTKSDEEYEREEQEMLKRERERDKKLK